MFFYKSNLSTVKRLILLLLISILMSACLTYATGHNQRTFLNWLIKQQSPHIAFDPKALVVDVRPIVDYTRSHIPGAISLDFMEWDLAFSTFLDVWSPERPVIIYCGGNACVYGREFALRLLTDLPNAKVFILKGGFSAWQSIQADIKGFK